MSNSTTNSTIMNCDPYGWYSPLIIYALSVMAPAYFVLGISGRLISLLAIYREKKGESAYLYQIFLLVSEALSVFSSSLYALFLTLSKTVGWFRSIYAFMWMTAYFAQILQYVFVFSTDLLTVAIATDRVYALMKPQVHGTLNHHKIQLIVLLISFLLSIAFSAPMAMVYAPVSMGDGTYTIDRSQFWLTNSQTLLRFIYAQYLFKGIIAISMIVSGIMLCVAFQRGMKNRAQVRSDDSANNSTTDQMKTLFKMTLVQSVCNTTTFVANLAYVLAVAVVDPLLQMCVLGPTVSFISYSIDILQFYVTLAITKRFRKMVMKTLRGFVPCQNNSVQVIEVQPIGN